MARRGTAARLLAAVSAVAALGGCTSTPAPTATGPAPTSASPSTCLADGLRLEAGPVDAASGLRAVALELSACDGSSHDVEGFPAVALLDDTKRELGTPIAVDQGVEGIAGSLPQWSGPAQPVTISPGGRAAVLVVWRNTYSDTTAPPVAATYLAVRVDGTSHLVAPDGGIDLGSTGRLGISAWQLPPA